MVKVVKRLTNLFEELSADRFFDLPVRALLLDILVQRYALNHICDDADLFARFNEVIHLDDVWMINLLEGHDFSLDCFALHRVIELDLLVNLDCVLLHVKFVVADVNCCVGTLANRLTDLVVIEYMRATKP